MILLRTLDTHNASIVCGVSKPTFQQWCKSEKVVAKKINGEWEVYEIPDELIKDGARL